MWMLIVLIFFGDGNPSHVEQIGPFNTKENCTDAAKGIKDDLADPAKVKWSCVKVTGYISP